MPAATDNPGNYALDRNALATTRLTAQHYIWSQTLGFELHPDIPAPAPDAKIADVATGSGLWLLDMSRKLPSTVQLDGFDISLNQCPPTAWLPKNVRMHEWDIYEDIPEEFIGQYDIVHIRLIGIAVKNNDVSAMVANLTKMLKPGGYIQWDEVLNSEAYVARADPTTTTPALDHLCNWMKNPQKTIGIDQWKNTLPRDFVEAGFAHAHLHHYKESFLRDPSLIKTYTDTCIVLCEEFIAMVYKTNPKEANAHRQKLDAATQDARRGAGIVFPQIICVAQKGAES